ncbi:MAG TPA: hypothetical protein VFU15_17350, partial [Bacteroidia bacterium]|nr:hypothetical protein [Bacteroidia bacterium]
GKVAWMGNPFGVDDLSFSARYDESGKAFVIYGVNTDSLLNVLVMAFRDDFEHPLYSGSYSVAHPEHEEPNDHSYFFMHDGRLNVASDYQVDSVSIDSVSKSFTYRPWKFADSSFFILPGHVVELDNFRDRNDTLRDNSPRVCCRVGTTGFTQNAHRYVPFSMEEVCSLDYPVAGSSANSIFQAMRYSRDGGLSGLYYELPGWLVSLKDTALRFHNMLNCSALEVSEPSGPRKFHFTIPDVFFLELKNFLVHRDTLYVFSDVMDEYAAFNLRTGKRIDDPPVLKIIDKRFMLASSAWFYSAWILCLAFIPAFLLFLLVFRLVKKRKYTGWFSVQRAFVLWFFPSLYGLYWIFYCFFRI